MSSRSHSIDLSLLAIALVTISSSPALAITVMDYSEPTPLVPSLSGQQTHALSGQLIRSLPSQVVRSLPGQHVRSLPGQIVKALPGQLVRSLPGQLITPVGY